MWQLTYTDSRLLKNRAAGSVRKSVGGDNSSGMGGCKTPPPPTSEAD